MGLRKGLNLNLRSLERWIMLLHGDLNTFKTYLAGAFLAAIIRAGGTAVFLNVQGEDGMTTLANFPEIIPSKHIWEADDYAGLKEAMEYLEAHPVDGLSIDSGKAWANLVMYFVTLGVDRPLRIPKEKGEESQDWPELIHYVWRNLTNLRPLAKRVIMTCPSDLSASFLDLEKNQWKKTKKIMPDFPGQKLPGQSPGWFDFVGYCESTILSPGNFHRELHFESSIQWSSRARVEIPFDSPVVIPDCVRKDGCGAWFEIERELRAHFNEGGETPVDTATHPVTATEVIKSVTTKL